MSQNDNNLLSPQRLVDLCTDESGVGLKNAKHRAVMEKNLDHALVVLKEHRINIFSVQHIEAGDFANAVADRAGSDEVKWPAQKWMVSLQKKAYSQQTAQRIPVYWQCVVNAVAHEMTRAMAQRVASVSSNLVVLNKNSGKALIAAIHSKKPLAVPEAQYLQSLIVRATTKITLNPPDDDS